MVVQFFARCLCKKLWRSVLKWFLNTGIRVCTKNETANLAVWTVTSHSTVYFWCISLERKGKGKINKGSANRGLEHVCTCTQQQKKANQTKNVIFGLLLLHAYFRYIKKSTYFWRMEGIEYDLISYSSNPHRNDSILQTVISKQDCHLA